MPTFCRHNRIVTNCPICSREQHVEMRAVISSSTPASSRPPARKPPSSGGAAKSASPGRSSSSRLRVRKLARGADDGYHSEFVPGLKSSADAERLAKEIAFAAHRLQVLENDPPGLYREVADSTVDAEERAWLAFLIAFFAPLEDVEDPFATVSAVRTTWASGQMPSLEGVAVGPRAAYEAPVAERTLGAYRAWAGRAGSQAAAFEGESFWTPERRFARDFERMAFPGFPRNARFDLLVTLGRLGVFGLRAGALQLGGDNEVTVAAKRALGIGDPMLLERRAADLAAACAVELEALDVALHNWGRGVSFRFGLGASAQADEDLLAAVRDGLGLD